MDSFDFGFNGSTNASAKDTETTISVNWVGGGQIKDGKCIFPRSNETLAM